MAFRFKRKESVVKAVRRIVGERIKLALVSLEECDKLEGIYKTRKEIKKLRAILRLIRKDLDGKTFRMGTKALRKMAKRLAGVRDAQVALHTCDNLIGDFKGQLSERSVMNIRNRLARNCRDELKQFIERDSAESVRKILHEMAEDLKEIDLERNSWKAINSRAHASKFIPRR